MKAQIVLVSITGVITSTVYDKALFMNGELLMLAKKFMTPFESISELTLKLARLHCVDVIEVSHQVADAGWDWLSIRNDLLVSGVLVSAEDTFASADSDVRFSVYGGVLDSVMLSEIVADENCVARVEKSGCEGYMVEVVRCSDDYGWRRYAFFKSFEEEEALVLASRINENAAYASVFHKMVARS